MGKMLVSCLFCTEIAKLILYSFITLMMEAVRTSVTLVCFNEATKRCIPEGSNLQKLYCGRVGFSVDLYL
jgi:hypothetical protein